MSCSIAAGSPSPIMSLPFENNSTKVNSMLSIQDLLPNDEGTYECVASNEEGGTGSTINVYVQGG